MKTLNNFVITKELVAIVKENLTEMLETEFDTKLSPGKADYVTARALGFENHHALKAKLENRVDEYWRFIELASEFFLTEPLPNEAKAWEDEELANYATEHAWQPFEYWVGEDLIEVIGDAANTISNAVYNHPQKQ